MGIEEGFTRELQRKSEMGHGRDVCRAASVRLGVECVPSGLGLLLLRSIAGPRGSQR